MHRCPPKMIVTFWGERSEHCVAAPQEQGRDGASDDDDRLRGAGCHSHAGGRPGRCVCDIGDRVGRKRGDEPATSKTHSELGHTQPAGSDSTM